MRIFTPGRDGVHPAFPPDPDPAASCTPLPETVRYASLLGLLRLGFAFTFRRPQPLESASKTVAYATVALGVLGGIDLAASHFAAKNFLASQNIDLPRPKFFHRIGYIDEDDRLILGGCLGVLTASGMRRTWTITGWKRYVTAFTLGSSVSWAAHYAYRQYSMTADQKDTYNTAQKKWRAQHHEWFALVHSYGPLRFLAKSEASVNFGVNVNAGNEPNSSGILAPPTSNVGMQLKEVRDGPHVALQAPDDVEPLPMPITNYAWSSSQPIQDLEQHVARLTARRQQLAREAELLWAWLSEKEAKYYNQSQSSEGEPATPERREELAYIIQLGNAHVQTWREVNSHDWMIADSNKRLAQLRSKLDGDNDKVTWRAGCSEAARDVKPEFAIRTLKRVAEQVGPAHLNALHMVKAGMRRDAAAYKAMRESQERIFNPFQNKITTKGEWVVDSEKKIEEGLKNVRMEVEQAEKLKSDIEGGQK